MGQVVYQLAVLLVYAAATFDALRLKPALPAAALNPRARTLHELAHRIALAWFILQASWLIFFALSGDLHRAISRSIFYVTNSMMLFLIIPAGMIWSSRAGAPIFPLLGRRNFRVRRPTALFAMLALFSLALTGAVVYFAKWSADPKLDEILETSSHSHFANAAFGIYLLLSAPIAEEFVFRHYLQNRLVAFNRNVAWRIAAVVIVAAVFALGHGGMISPAWVKFAQIFGFGIALGISQMFLGIECCIGLHLIFNLGAAVMGLVQKGT